MGREREEAADQGVPVDDSGADVEVGDLEDVWAGDYYSAVGATAAGSCHCFLSLGGFGLWVRYELGQCLLTRWRD